VAEDGQVRDNGYLVAVEATDGTQFELVASPVQFDESSPELRRGPGFAEHTDDVLLELGYDWDRIIQLKTDGTVT
jgi:crotonobetainyl-CoA:carnitine CoA-transferase CaiB-like acyl-CoA transferase